jgi:branched-chain amino acid transport system ATP-binding protein
MLIVENIISGYGKKQVLNGVSFVVNDGEIVLLTGGNGSGKSTVLKCIYGLLKVWNEGRITFDGEDITGLSPSSMIKRGIVYIPQKNNYFENLTVQSNLEVAGNTINEKAFLANRIYEVYE